MNSRMDFLERVSYRTIRILAAMGTTAVFGFNTVPSVFPSTVESLRSVPDTGIPDNAPGKRYECLLNEVCCKMNVNSRRVRLFYNDDFDTVSGGCLYLPGQCVIGLPRNCLYGTVEDLRTAPTRNCLYGTLEDRRTAPITFEKKKINWDSKTGKALIDVLLVSDEHVKFLMAQELTRIKEKHFVPMTVHATSFFVLAYKGGMLLSKLPGSLFGRLLSQALVWGIAAMLYIETRKKVFHWSEYAADEGAARLGVDYADGGVGCMQSHLKLNRVMRKINEDGTKMFSKVGDNLQTLYTHPKRTDRLKKIKEIKKEFGKVIAE